MAPVPARTITLLSALSLLSVPALGQNPVVVDAPSSQPAASNPADTVPFGAADDGASTAEKWEDGATETETASSAPATGFDDPFFAGDIDKAMDNVDTQWQDDAVVAKQVKAFVGKPSLWSSYRKLLKHEVFSLELQTRVLASVQEIPDTRPDGIEIAQLRAKVKGKIGHGFDYVAQVDATSSPALVDAVIGYAPIKALKLSIGRMKTPFSGEYLQSDPSLNFILRSEAVLALATKRSEGAQLSGELFERRLRYRFGAFNGSGLENLGWGTRLLYAGRLVVTPLRIDLGSWKFLLELGLSAALGPDERLEFSAITPLASAGTMEGVRALGGVDLLLHLGPAWIAAEGIYGQYQGASSTLGDLAFWASGGYAELGVQLIPGRVEAMARYDALYTSLTDVLGQFAIAGLRVHATEFFRIQLNYAWGPVRGASSARSANQLLAVFQLVL